MRAPALPRRQPKPAAHVHDELLPPDAWSRRHRALPLLLAALPVAVVAGVFMAGRAGGTTWLVGAPALVVVVAAAAGQAWSWFRSNQDHEAAAGLAAELAAAGEQAQRRKAIGDLMVTLARRNQALIERQLALIDGLEHDEEDPDRLANLFRLDHFATRMRRNAESLLVLSGNEPSRRWQDPLPASEVVRGAVSEVEDYTRVDVRLPHEVAVAGHAVSDVAHLMAELIENATAFSPPDTLVVVGGREVADGFELRVEDRGLGLTDGDLVGHNHRLTHPVDLDIEVSRTLGLHVVARLAARHGITVHLDRNGAGGVTATVALPADLVAGPVSTRMRVAADPDLASLHHVDAHLDRLAAELAPPVPVGAPAPLHPDHPAGSSLARRVPQASLAKEMRDHGPLPPPVPPAAEAAPRPDQLRAKLSSFQSGLASGRTSSAHLFAVPTETEGP